MKVPSTRCGDACTTTTATGPESRPNGLVTDAARNAPWKATTQTDWLPGRSVPIAPESAGS
jgi:hypothetical protein